MVSSVKSSPNHYEILGLTPSASDRDIAEAYTARIGKHLLPTDKAGPGSRDEARQLISAYNTLSDPTKRKAYDASLSLKPTAKSERRLRVTAESGVVPFIAAKSDREVEQESPNLAAPSDRRRRRADAAAAGAAQRRGKKHSAPPVAQGYTLGYFARKHNLSLEQARELMARVGKDRRKLNEAAEQLKAAPAPSATLQPSSIDKSSPSMHVDRQDSFHKQASGARASGASPVIRARRFPAATAGAALMGVGLVAISAAMLAGYLELPQSAPRQNTPPRMTASADGSGAARKALPQTAPTQQETVAPSAAERARMTGEVAGSSQTTFPDGAVEKQSSRSVPSDAAQSLEAPRTAAQATTTRTVERQNSSRRAAVARANRIARQTAASRAAAGWASAAARRDAANRAAVAAAVARHNAARRTTVAAAKKYCIAYDQITGSRLAPAPKCGTRQEWAKEGVNVDTLFRVTRRPKRSTASATKRYCITYDVITGTRLRPPPPRCGTRQDWVREGVDVDKLL